MESSSQKAMGKVVLLARHDEAYDAGTPATVSDQAGCSTGVSWNAVGVRST